MGPQYGPLKGGGFDRGPTRHMEDIQQVCSDPGVKGPYYGLHFDMPPEPLASAVFGPCSGYSRALVVHWLPSGFVVCGALGSWRILMKAVLLPEEHKAKIRSSTTSYAQPKPTILEVEALP